MGVDVHGFVEVRPRFRWSGATVGWAAAVDLDVVYDGRSYDAFGCLFGVKRFSFTPIAAERGLPADASEVVRRTRAEYGDCFGCDTWVGWAEILAVDWDEPADQGSDVRPRRYERGPDGEWTAGWMGLWNDSTFVREGIAPPGLRAGRATWPVGTEWTAGDVRFRAEQLTRRDAVQSDWQPVWDVMALLARLHGPDHVRLVVWFE